METNYRNGNGFTLRIDGWCLKDCLVIQMVSYCNSPSHWGNTLKENMGKTKQCILMQRMRGRME